MKVPLQRLFPSPADGYDTDLLQVLKKWQFEHAKAINETSGTGGGYSYQVPGDGFTLAIPDAGTLILDPAGMVGGTLTFPASADATIVRITSTQATGTLVFAGAVRGAPSSLNAGIGVAFQLANGVWYRLY